MTDLATPDKHGKSRSPTTHTFPKESDLLEFRRRLSFRSNL